MAPLILPAPTFTREPFFGFPDLLFTTGSGANDGATTEPAPPSPMERSIRSVMAKYGAADLHGAALLPSYRCLRRRRPQEENQAVAVTHDDNTYKIMVDVREFVEGSVVVRAVGDSELVIEGVVESKQESQPSQHCRTTQSSSRNFQQRFMFPGLQVEGVTSSVSSDGVLTVIAPRKASAEKVVEFQMPVTGTTMGKQTVENQTSSSTSAQQTSSTVQSSLENQTSTSAQQTSSDVQSSQKSSIEQCSSDVNTQQSAAANLSSNETLNRSSQSVTTNSRGEHIVPIQLEGEVTSSTVAESTKQQSTQQQSQSTQLLKQNDIQQVSSQDTTKTSNNSVINVPIQQVSSQDTTKTSNNSVMDVPISTNTLGRASSLFGNLFRDSLVPIDSRGLFFQDSFFENSRRHFQEAVDKVMRREQPNINIGSTDPLNWYTNLRSSNRVEDTRAGTITTEGNNYKVVLDVRDFEDGSVSVRAVGESELLVEGKMDKKTDGTTIMRSFRRRFVMPGHVKCEGISSALSADGVLTITAPKSDSNFSIVELKGDHSNMTKSALTNSSVFGSATPSCASPSISIPASVVASPTSEMSGPFEPVFSKTPCEASSAQSQNNLSSATSTNTSETTFSEIPITSSVQSQNNLSSVSSSNTSETMVKATQNIASNATSHQSTLNEQTSESSKILNTEKELTIPIQLEQQTNSKEKIVSINYIDKNQKDIDSQPQSSPQYQLIGSVKDLTDSNLKETVKQRKSVTSNAMVRQQSRDIAINYDNPAGFAFPIVRRGPFYQDSFFNEVHTNFQSAVRQVLDRWVDVPSLLSRNTEVSSFHNLDRFHDTLSNYRSILDRDSFDDFACYKSLRSRSVKEENQASTVRESAEDYKVVLDVHGFTEKDLTIRATSHNELVIEGNVEQSSTGSMSSHKFRKQFILPGRVRMEAVYSALSEDDILTITVPKNTALSITDKA